MKNYKLNSGQYIVYTDHSTSGLGGFMGQSTADPVSLAAIMGQPIILTRRVPKPDMQVKPFEQSSPVPASLAQEFAAWDAASDEALINFERENL
jgi:hypothetical protein